MNNSDITILLRHDIDHRTSVNHIPRVVDIERDNGVRSTIFIRTDALMNLEYLLELQDDGWEFGLHLSSRIKHIAVAQIVYLQSLGFRINGLSACGSIHLGDTEWHWYDPERSFENWRMLDCLGMDYICNFGLIPPSILTPIVESGPFVIDNQYVANYDKEAFKKLMEDVFYYKERYLFPFYPILVHPDNMYFSTAKFRFLDGLFAPVWIKRYFKRGINRLGIGNSLKPFTKVVQAYKDNIITYRDAVPLIGESGVGFNLSEEDNLNRPINEENHRGAVKRNQIIKEAK